MIRVDKEKTLSLASTLIRIPSENPPGDEREIADYLSSEIGRLGFRTFEYDFKPGRPNMVGVLKSGKKRSMIFDGHLDTVPVGRLDEWTTDPFAGTIRDGKLYGRGAADMKSSIAAFISAVRAVLDTGADLMGDITIFLVSDEEVTGLGTKDILSKGYGADMAIVGEPTGLAIHIAHKGVVRWKLATVGKAAHSSVPHEGLNAISKMAKLLQKLDGYSERIMKESDDLLGPPTLSVNTIKGGEKDNVIPDYCEVSIDRRLTRRERPERAEKELTELLEAVRMEDKDLIYRLNRYSCLEPSETKPDAEIVRILQKAAAKVTGGRPEILGFKATCQMVHLVKEGIPTVIFGCGGLDEAHKPDEHVDVEELVTAANVYAQFLLDPEC